MANTRKYETIVIGLGAMGSAALCQLAQRGKRVLGIEQFGMVHDMGSYHGVTRIIRLAYHEHPSYVPLVRRSIELWRDLERASGEQVFHVTGTLDAAAPDHPGYTGALRSCAEHDLPHEVLTSAEVTRRFPGYRLPAETMAVFQRDGGFLHSERCVALFTEQAQRHGAAVHTNERLLEWRPCANGVRVRTERGEYESETLVITAGAWASKLLPSLGLPAVPERQALIWMEPLRPELFTPEAFPVFSLTIEGAHYYGTPVFGAPGFKLGRSNHLREQVDPDHIDREPNARDEAVLRGLAEKYFPDAAGATLAMKVCMFTNSPDEHFIIDRLPDAPQVAVAAGFSGHGFKFASVIGEILAELALDGATRHEVGMFRLARFKDATRPRASA